MEDGKRLPENSNESEGSGGDRRRGVPKEIYKGTLAKRVKYTILQLQKEMRAEQFLRTFSPLTEF